MMFFTKWKTYNNTRKHLLVVELCCRFTIKRKTQTGPILHELESDTTR